MIVGRESLILFVKVLHFSHLDLLFQWDHFQILNTECLQFVQVLLHNCAAFLSFLGFFEHKISIVVLIHLFHLTILLLDYYGFILFIVVVFLLLHSSLLINDAYFCRKVLIDGQICAGWLFKILPWVTILIFILKTVVLLFLIHLLLLSNLIVSHLIPNMFCCLSFPACLANSLFSEITIGLIQRSAHTVL